MLTRYEVRPIAPMVVAGLTMLALIALTGSMVGHHLDRARKQRECQSIVIRQCWDCGEIDCFDAAREACR